MWGDRSGERVHPDDAICGVELLLRLFAHGGRFFTDGWSVFDLLTVSIALVPRVLRLMSAVPAMRRVVLPGNAVSIAPGVLTPRSHQPACGARLHVRSHLLPAQPDLERRRSKA